ncbi:MAG: histidinol-phosphatase HisJ family protein [Ruminococcus sp.]|nr:histidinol-phosphatase HisJ family protein [Ruminococcus sp.]
MIDCHTHTNNSPDAESTPYDMVKKGIEIGLNVMAITDHCEVNMWYPKEHYKETFDYDDYNYMQSFEKSLADIVALKEQFKGDIKLICGIELGQAFMDFTLAEEIISDRRLDFVIGSVHQIYGFQDFFNIDYSKVDIYTLMQGYFLTILKLCKWGKFDILAHLTYPLRYIYKAGYSVDMHRFEPTIKEIFKTIIDGNIGLEVNTSGLRQGCGFPFPTAEYVKMYKDLGGSIISVGSDAHSTDQLANDVQSCIDMIKSCGFEYLTYYVDRKPIQYKI